MGAQPVTSPEELGRAFKTHGRDIDWYVVSNDPEALGESWAGKPHAKWGGWFNPPTNADFAAVRYALFDFDPLDGVEPEVAQAEAVELIRSSPFQFRTEECSGRGIQAVLDLGELVTADDELTRLFKRAASWFAARTKHIKVDTSCLTFHRAKRLPGTANTRTGAYASVLRRRDVTMPVAELRALCDKLKLEETPTRPKSKGDAVLPASAVTVEDDDALVALCPEAQRTQKLRAWAYLAKQGWRDGDPPWIEMLKLLGGDDFLAELREKAAGGFSEVQHATFRGLLAGGCPPEALLGIATDESWGVSSQMLKMTVRGTKPRGRNWKAYAVRQVQQAIVQHSPPGNGATAASAPAGVIELDEPDLLKLVGECFTALKGRGIFRRPSGELARMRTLEADECDDDVRRFRGLVEVVRVEPYWLTSELSAAASFVVYDARARRFKPKTPPLSLAQHALARGEDAPFPVLAGIARTPTLTRGEPGYDETSGMYLAFEPGEFPPVPLRPSKVEAEAALKRLRHPLSAYKWADNWSESVALSAMLCAVCPGEFDALPMHLFDATAAGSGKSKLATIVGMIGLGVPPTTLTYTGDPAEDEKRLAAALLRGDSIIRFDNVSRMLEGDLLCAAITEPVVHPRVLGRSEAPAVSSRVLLLATGNNLQTKGDIARRVVACRIDPGVEKPFETAFEFDPVEVVRANRAQFVADALTVLRWAAHDGGGVALGKSFGSFEGYGLVRRALVGLGLADPCDSIDSVVASDVGRNDIAELFTAWAKTFGVGRKFETTVTQLREAPALAGLLGGDSVQGTGMWLRHRRDTICSGLVLRGKVRDGANRWWIEDAKAPKEVTTPTAPTPF